ncbi:DNA phosphorothioation system sulfurtransferase DndC [bacterium 1XD21-13]|nr:DNA phosphorothioation system sulfurtransferase DndC [bacterium 1XD21-13]
MEEMKTVYCHDKRPWLIGFSGGKDSTLLCCLVFEMLQRLDCEKISKKVYVVSSDTMVENPLVGKYMRDMSQLIGEQGATLGIESSVITPDIDKTFWSCLIGLGYPTPEAPGFRWCTDKLKIRPLNKYVLDVINQNGEIVMLLGVRKAESSYRARGIKSREIEGKLLIRHTDIKNAYVYNPLTEIPNERIWSFLLSGDARTPWNSDNKYLFSLYQGENLSEEESALGQVDENKMTVTGNSRFGCWICTMVKEDKSLKNFIEHGETWLVPLRDFRNWLLTIRENPDFRDKRRRNGSVYVKDDGQLGFGSFSMAGRRRILKRLLELEVQTGLELITVEELKMIDKMWEKEGDLFKRTLVDLYYEVKGKRLAWDEYRLPLYAEDAFEIIARTCEEYDIEYDMLCKLVIAIENNKHFTRGQKVNKAFDRVVNEGWLHYENIKQAKEDIEHED